MGNLKIIFMRKFYFLAFIFAFVLSSAQTYSFDTVTKYVLNNAKKKGIKESVNYFNSDDFNYFLKVTRVPDYLSATLFDSKTDLAHHFTVKESKSNGNIFFAFEYDYSYKLNTKHLINQKKYITFGEISESYPKQVSMQIFSSKKAKKPIAKHILTLQPASKNMFPMFALSRSVNYMLPSDADLPGNYMVVRDDITEKKVSCEFVLEDHNDVKLKITLPKTLNF